MIVELVLVEVRHNRMVAVAVAAAHNRLAPVVALVVEMEGQHLVQKALALLQRLAQQQLVQGRVRGHHPQHHQPATAAHHHQHHHQHLYQQQPHKRMTRPVPRMHHHSLTMKLMLQKHEQQRQILRNAVKALASLLLVVGHHKARVA